MALSLADFSFLLLSYLVGSTGLYLFLPDFRQDLHSKGSGNTTVLHGLQQGHLIPAIANLVVETLKPILLVLFASNWLGIESSVPLLFGVCAAVLGRMFPLFLRLKNGGKGSMTAVFGIVTVYPALIPIMVVNIFLQVVFLKLRREFYRPYMNVFYLVFPLLGAWWVNNWYAVFPLLTGSLLSLGFGWLRPEDMEIGYQRIRSQADA